MFGTNVALQLARIRNIFVTMNATYSHFQDLYRINPSKVLAVRAIFDAYSLSPDDRDEAVARYRIIVSDVFTEGRPSSGLENRFAVPGRAVEGVPNGEYQTFLPNESAVGSILYSMNCENVWRRNPVAIT